MRRIALLAFVWRHRRRLVRWAGFVIRALPRVIAGDRSLYTELRLLAMLEQDARFPHVRVDVTGRTARFSGSVSSMDDAVALEAMAARLGLGASVHGIRARRRVGSRSAGGEVAVSR